MDLSKTIADMEEQASRYQEAANTLRALQDGTSAEATALSSGATVSVKTVRATPGKGQATQTEPKGAGRTKRFVSPETRDKLAASMRARHAARKAGISA